MRPKQALRARTWGTRFDPLPSSPPSSPPTRQALAVQYGASDSVVDAPTNKREDKMPHDASIFVGSLPPNIEQPELTRMLSEHLSEHAEVKNIKVVRDSKGGICAFVQCEDASAAATLIHTLHSIAPKPFLGRILRYEPARAFRTLLISYRTPMKHIPPSSEGTVPDYNQGGKPVELDLPYAMRLCRPTHSKFMNLLYNAEAHDAEIHATADQAQLSADAVLYLQPILFDAETIYKIAAHFGPLEHFGPHKPPGTTSNEEDYDNTHMIKYYPPPHDAPRTMNMDAGCWEIKWEHRDDCVSALMTLRRVPHLTVTWAHQPPPFIVEQHFFNQSHRSYRANPHPFHNQDGVYDSQPQADPTASSSLISQFHYVSGTGRNNLTVETKQAITAAGNVHETVISPLPSSTIQPNERARKSDPELVSGSNDSSFQRNNEKTGVIGDDRIDWTEMDFPPLGDPKAERKLGCGAWGERATKSDKGEAVRSPPSSAPPHMEQLTNLDAISKTGSHTHPEDEQELDMPPTPGFGMSPITPQTPGSLFPTTPTSTSDELHSTATKAYECKERIRYCSDINRVERELDPTTLFVGGLDLVGPDAWDEEKVGNFFAKFGGLEEVKVVRPLNSRSAFAFVKFNNTESPARAVLEEHNRVYAGRAMRVQLRDCNPPHRGTWKYGRGRGKYLHQHSSPQRRHLEANEKPSNGAVTENDLRQGSPAVDQHDECTSGSDLSDIPSVATLNDSGNRSVTPEARPPGLLGNASHECVSKKEALFNDTSSGPHITTSSQSSSQPSGAPTETPSQHYREWCDEPVPAAFTPPPSSFGSSASLPAPVLAPHTPYPVSTAGYYLPPWMQPYPQQLPYPVPYFGGYPGYSIPGQQMNPTFTNPAGTDTSSPAGAQNTWPAIGGMYNSYIPYPGYPPRVPGTDQSQQQSNGQAPLLPTGFIQNDQGALVAVYQPEALDQYMAAAQPTPTQSMPSWSHYPQPHSHPYLFPGPTPQMMNPPSRQLQSQGTGVGWTSSQSQLVLPPPHRPHHHPALPANTGASASVFRGGYHQKGGQPSAPPLRRQQLQSRRDQQNMNANPNRNNHSRPHANRYFSRNINHGGHLHGISQPATHPMQLQDTGDRSQWATDH